MNTLNSTSRTSEEMSSLLLKNDWTTPGLKEPLSRDTMLRGLDTISSANAKALGALSDDFEVAYASTEQFVNNAFDVFEKKSETEQFDWAFAVPARGEQTQGEEYASEVTFFLPLLDPKFGVNAMIRQRMVSNLAPTVIEMYKGNEAGIRGALLWTPPYFDPNKRNIDNVNAARYRVNEAAGFAYNTLGTKVIGLGAILPGITNLGRKITQEGLITTTGHGGTVHLVAETVREVSEQLQKTPRVGVLGLGAIGYSSLQVLRESTDESKAHSFVVYDKDDSRIHKAMQSNERNIPTSPANDAIDLLSKSDIIVTAITDTINLDTEEQLNGKPIDLRGKVIIDDSQPGCFNREQVEARGGHLVWVVGEDTTEQHAFKRINGYRYGEAGGLYGDRAVWGCEAEAGSIAMSGEYEYAVKSSVTPEIARKVGKICFDAGIRVANPLQSFGQAVDI